MNKLTLIISSLMCLTAGQVHAEKLNLTLDNIGISGLSSGGYMANQFHLAHSDWVDRVGIIAAGPFYCAQNSIKTALEQCVSKSTKNTDINLPLQATIYADDGKIASLDNLKNSRVWLLSGTKDEKIHPDVAKALYQQYLEWVDSEDINFVNDQPFAHHFPTLNTGSKCDVSSSPFLGNCGYDAAGEMLNFLYPALTNRVEKPQGKLVKLDQQKLGGQAATSLADTGYAYVPQSCQAGETCQVHINFHGCQQNEQTIGLQYIQGTGINNWADSNNMVVLYPQTKNSMFLPLNPQGCWDWWGYTGEAYATNAGEQVQAVKNIAESLAEQLDIKN
jgi:poly(3-hydroxybutyrate) depolymerase